MNKRVHFAGTLVAGTLLVVLLGLVSLSALANDVVETAQFPASSENQDRLTQGGDQTTAAPISILDLHANDGYISQTVAITGEYVAWDLHFLALSYAEFEANEAPGPGSLGLGRLWVYGWLLNEGRTRQAVAFAPTNAYEYLGYQLNNSGES